MEINNEKARLLINEDIRMNDELLLPSDQLL